MEVVPFQIEHFDRMDIEERDMLSRGNRAAYEAYSKAGPCFTLMNDTPIYSGGIVINWQGCGTIWMLPSIHVKKYALSTVRYARQQLNKFTGEYGLHRVQAMVKADDAAANNFALHFGLQVEGVMRHYWIDKSDYNLYARIN